MNRLHKASGEDGTSVATGVAALAFPPTELAGVEHWNQDIGVIPEFDLEIFSDDAGGSLSAAAIYGGVPLTQIALS